MAKLMEQVIVWDKVKDMTVVQLFGKKCQVRDMMKNIWKVIKAKGLKQESK